MLALSALELVRCESMLLDSMKDITEIRPFQVLGQCTGTLHPGWGEAVLVGCPPLTQKMEVNSSGFIFLNCSGVGAAFHPAGPQHARKPHGRLEKLTLCHSKACSGDINQPFCKDYYKIKLLGLHGEEESQPGCAGHQRDQTGRYQPGIH